MKENEKYIKLDITLGKRIEEYQMIASFVFCNIIRQKTIRHSLEKNIQSTASKIKHASE